MTPTHVVIDVRDGYTWHRGLDGIPFTEATATAFAEARNSGMHPEAQTYAVAAVTITKPSPASAASLAAFLSEE